jgi:hypothetical protein
MVPGREIILTATDLTRAANDRRTDPECRKLALDAIKEFGQGETVWGGAVEREHLIRLYSRRLRRKADIVPFPAGTEELVSRLTTDTTATPIIVAARQKEDHVVYFFCSPDTSWLIGCIAAQPPLADALDV